MAKKKTIMPIAKCDVTGCTRDAAYGYREQIDVTNNDSPNRVREFIMGDCLNWCQTHDAEQRPIYAYKNGQYVIHPSQTRQE